MITRDENTLVISLQTSKEINDEGQKKFTYGMVKAMLSHAAHLLMDMNTVDITPDVVFEINGEPFPLPVAELNKATNKEEAAKIYKEYGDAFAERAGNLLDSNEGGGPLTDGSATLTITSGPDEHVLAYTAYYTDAGGGRIMAYKVPSLRELVEEHGSSPAGLYEWVKDPATPAIDKHTIAAQMFFQIPSHMKEDEDEVDLFFWITKMAGSLAANNLIDGLLDSKQGIQVASDDLSSYALNMMGQLVPSDK